MKEEYGTPLTPEETKLADDTIEKIHALVEKLPPSIEYSVFIGLNHVHSGKIPYLLVTVGELLSRICTNLTQAGGRAVMAALPLVQIQMHIVHLVGSQLAIVAKKYGVEIPEEGPEPDEKEGEKKSPVGFNFDGEADA